MTATSPTALDASWERFEALYRSSRDDVYAYVATLLRERAAAELRAGRCDALMVHWRLVTRRLVEAVHEARGELYVWTVDEAPRIRTLEALGVTGIITNDPRLFGAHATA